MSGGIDVGRQRCGRTVFAAGLRFFHGLAGGIFLLPFCPPWQFTGEWNILSGVIYAYVIVFGTVAAFGFYLGSIKYIQPAEASILGSVEPLAAIILSIIFLQASFGVMDILGTFLIIGTVFLLAKNK